ncbi:glycoside hydrolase family 76 protein [Granulicella paludicola]|uniref:glycoside hydrolase family 76 protein n=1 Tax=Granulicella paludicola TaxID=474951 RepID=UPI0021E0F6AD|nr:glycoside hydrolase family 76 protein [Granulicella paludicola]
MALNHTQENSGVRAVFFNSLLFFCFFAPSPVSTQPSKTRQPDEQQRRVESAAHNLSDAYDTKTGLFRGTGWWNSANGITALARVGRELHTREFNGIFQNTFTIAQNKSPGFLNEFYDDEGWWALAWLDVHEIDKNPRYLEMSKSIFTDMSGGWSDTCGGGIWWKKNEHYKNAIANELFLSVAVRLAEASSGEERARYLDWAQREEQWFVHSGMINTDGLVNDGLDSSCRNNQQTTWSYNQGVILTGLSQLSQITGDASALALANRIANAVQSKLTDAQDVLHDPCESKCGDDGVQFKGILVRNLGDLQEISASAGVRRLLEANAQSVWDKARTTDGHFSVNWAGPPQDDGTGSLISALDALTAPLLLRPL